MNVPLTLLKVVVLAAALGLELSGLRLIANDNATVEELVTILLSHVALSLVAALVFFSLLTYNLSIKYKWHGHLLFFILNLYLPVIGILGSLLAIPFLLDRKTQSAKRSISFEIRSFRDLPEVAIDSEINLTNNLHDLLSSKDISKRLEAVYATLKLKDEDTIVLLRKALMDPVDDIRLLAYALLDRKENLYSKRIAKNKYILESTVSQNNKKIYQQITSDYWELVRIGLVTGEARIHTLGKAHLYAETGLKYFPNDLKLRFLYTKILLKQKQYLQADAQLKEIERLGIDHHKLSVYYAEIAFHNRQYRKVENVFQGIESLTPYPKLSFVSQFWKKERSETAETR